MWEMRHLAVLLLLLQEVVMRVCFAFQSLFNDHCRWCVFNRAIGPMKMARKTRELLPLSMVCSWFWSVRGECQAEPEEVIQ